MALRAWPCMHACMGATHYCHCGYGARHTLPACMRPRTPSFCLRLVMPSTHPSLSWTCAPWVSPLWCRPLWWCFAEDMAICCACAARAPRSKEGKDTAPEGLSAVGGCCRCDCQVSVMSVTCSIGRGSLFVRLVLLVVSVVRQLLVLSAAGIVAYGYQRT